MEDPPPPALKLEDTEAQRGPAAAGGYNPYDTGRTVKNRAVKLPGTTAEPAQPRKPTDLRKLSEWIKAQRRAEAAKAEQPAGDEAANPDSAEAPGVTNPRR